MSACTWSHEAKARRVLPQFFPRAAQALPTLTQENASRLVDSRDIESFMKAIDKQVAHAPKRKGPGWGGSVAEFWHWAVKYTDEWAPIRQFLLQLALAVTIAPETYQAYASARILAADRDEANKVRPLGLGGFFPPVRQWSQTARISRASAESHGPYQYAAGNADSRDHAQDGSAEP